MTMHVQLPATMPDLDEMEAGLKRSLDLFQVAFDKIQDAEAAIQAARTAIQTVTPGMEYHSHRDAKECEDFFKAVRLPKRDTYLRVARKLGELRCWHYVMDRCGLAQLMDAQAKREFESQLRYVPDRVDRDGELITEEEAEKGMPPFTAENARATLDTLQANAGMIWRRGIAKAFGSLDRRFRSHDGFKVGSRIILTRLARDSGSIDYWSSEGDAFRDIEKTFHVLDGRDPRHIHTDFLRQVDRERGYGVQQSEHANEYFRVIVYKNGNAHLWFERKDLVKLVNKELAAYYGEVIGDGNTKEADPFEKRATTPAKLFGFYPTPPNLAKGVSKKVPHSETPLRILEPSAGTGNIANALLHKRGFDWERGQPTKWVQHRVDCIEIQSELAAALRGSGKFGNVTTADFLQVQPNPNALYDGVVMNPPFDMERDIDHVVHALKFLKPDGFLLSIMSAGVEFRETRKATAFRKLIADRKGWMVDLPDGSFASVGTYVNTVLVGINAGSKPWRFND